MKTRTIVMILAGCLVLTAAIGWNLVQEDTAPKVVVYKSPTCGCCVKWAAMLEEAGFEVEARNVERMAAVKREFTIDRALWSCHTAIIDDHYLVEGHVPIEQIKRMLSEKPDIRGLAVPGMPIGSPGMEGPNPETYQVLAFEEDGHSVYATITP